jgi:Flp pilus assembly protein TadG
MAGRPSRARGRLRERGAVVVEAAIAMLPFLTLVLGILEGSLLIGNYVGTAHAVRAGARAASAVATDPQTDFAVLQRIKQESTSMRRSSIVYIVVYKANSSGDGPTATCKAGTPVSGVCNVYTAADMVRPTTDFGCIVPNTLDSFWCPSERKTALTLASGGPPDYVGVWMKVNHSTVSGIVGKQRTITDYSVLRIEPRKK